MTSDMKELQKLVKDLKNKSGADAKVPDRVKAVNSLLNGGNNIKLLDAKHVDLLWDALFFAVWSSEVGRGFEDITAAISRCCPNYPALILPGFKTIAQKWYGLDQYRVDKFSHLTRHLVSLVADRQIYIWLKLVKKGRGKQWTNLNCKHVISSMLADIKKSFGMSDFVLEIVTEEICKSYLKACESYRLSVGHQVLKGKMMIFIYNQFLRYVANPDVDQRLITTFDTVFKSFLDQILAHESQVSQILITLRLSQSAAKLAKKKSSNKKAERFLLKWSRILSEIHEKTMNGKYFPISELPMPCDKL